MACPGDGATLEKVPACLAHPEHTKTEKFRHAKSAPKDLPLRPDLEDAPAVLAISGMEWNVWNVRLGQQVMLVQQNALPAPQSQARVGPPASARMVLCGNGRRVSDTALLV